MSCCQYRAQQSLVPLPVRPSLTEITDPRLLELLRQILWLQDDLKTVGECHHWPPVSRAANVQRPAPSFQYTLPAPPGYWLFINRGTTLRMAPGPYDEDIPYKCGAGLVGGSTPAS